MPTDFEELRQRLLQTDDEFRQLATQHHDLDEKLHNLAARHYLSEPEQLEEVRLKKRKLQLKDQMESILRRRSGSQAALAGQHRGQAEQAEETGKLFHGLH